MKNKIYPTINIERTGKRLKHLLESAGFTPKMLQAYLHLSCVQPIYRWYKGTILPSVDHLLMLSGLLGVHMEELLVKECAPIIGLYDIDWIVENRRKNYLLNYYTILKKGVA